MDNRKIKRPLMAVKVPVLNRTISLQEDLYFQMEDVAAERGISFSAAVGKYIRKGIAHDAIVEMERKKRKEVEYKKRLKGAMQEILSEDGEKEALDDY